MAFLKFTLDTSEIGFEASYCKGARRLDDDEKVFIVVLMLAGNVDLLRSAAPKDAHNQGSRPGEQSQGLPLDGEPRPPKWKEERNGATLG
jgi:hypothetical protein